jgi:hypothetical protein
MICIFLVNSHRLIAFRLKRLQKLTQRVMQYFKHPKIAYVVPLSN